MAAKILPTKPGDRYGNLVVVSLVPSLGRTPSNTWLCRCDCGKGKRALASALIRGDNKSCGCLTRTLLARARTTHGLSEGPEYRAWINIRLRCYSPTDASFKHYGAKGITVCDRWIHSFENFYADMGPRPETPPGTRLSDEMAPRDTVQTTAIGQRTSSKQSTEVTTR